MDLNSWFSKVLANNTSAGFWICKQEFSAVRKCNCQILGATRSFVKSTKVHTCQEDCCTGCCRRVEKKPAFLLNFTLAINLSLFCPWRGFFSSYAQSLGAWAFVTQALSAACAYFHIKSQKPRRRCSSGALSLHCTSTSSHCNHRLSILRPHLNCLRLAQACKNFDL